MKKYLSIFVTLTVLLTGCGNQEETKQADSPKKEMSQKKDEKSKAEQAKEKIEQNKKKVNREKSSTEESIQTPSTESQSIEQNIVTTEQATQEVVTQQPATLEQSQNNQPTEQQRIDFCKGIRGGIPEACRTPAIIEAGNKKGAIERQAMSYLESGLITEAEYQQRLQEATEIMNKAWLQEYGVDPSQG